MHKSHLIVAAFFLEMLLIPKTPCAAKIPIPKPFPEETGFYEMERKNTEKGGLRNGPARNTDMRRRCRM